jgi:PST family polysaccharide transporter
VLTPLTQLTIRKIIIHLLDLHHAGIWDAVNLISNNYFLFVSMTMSLLVLPEFSKATTKNEIYTIIKTLLFKIYPLFLLGLSLLFFVRKEITNILFSKDFYDINFYIGLQFVGDAIKFIGWIFGIFLIAKAQTKYFIIAEILSAFTYIIFSYFLCSFFNLIGVFYAYIIDNISYTVIVLIFFFTQLKRIN